MICIYFRFAGIW